MLDRMQKKQGIYLPHSKSISRMLTMVPLIEDIRQAVEASGKTRYRIAKDSGIAESQLSRLMSGERGLSIESLEQLAACLGLEITIRPKRRRKGR